MFVSAIRGQSSVTISQSKTLETQGGWDLCEWMIVPANPLLHFYHYLHQTDKYLNKFVLVVIEFDCPWEWGKKEGTKKHTEYG